MGGKDHDFKRQPQNRHSELLFRMVFQPDKRRLSLRPQSDECPSGQQDPDNAGFGGLHRILDEESPANAFQAGGTGAGYAQDIERNVPHKKNCMIPVFRELSRKIGKERVIWRYDPILFTDKYTPEYHLHAFRQIAAALQGYTVKCVISFLDMYAKIQKSMESMNVRSIAGSELAAFGKQLASIAGSCGIQTASCSETLDLAACGIAHNCCIDKALVEQITGYRIHADKDKNQRKECGCVESVEVGTYNTCRNGCLYCYANYSREKTLRSSRLYDVNSPILCGRITEDDRVTERKLRALRELQGNFFT